MEPSHLLSLLSVKESPGLVSEGIKSSILGLKRFIGALGQVFILKALSYQQGVQSPELPAQFHQVSTGLLSVMPRHQRSLLAGCRHFFASWIPLP